MNNGRIIVIAILGSTLLFGAGVWYTNTYAYYVELTDQPILMTRFDGEAEPLLISDFEGIDAETSPLRFRACFSTDISQATLTETYQPYESATPLNAPGWFSCFDAAAIGEAIEEGRALAFLGTGNQPYGFDTIVAIDDQGRGYAWPQLNDCGDAEYSGDPLPAHCPPPTP